MAGAMGELLRPSRLWWLGHCGGVAHAGWHGPLRHAPPVPELAEMTYIEFCPPAGPMECRVGHEQRRDMTAAECDAAMRYLIGIVTEAQDAADGCSTVVVVAERSRR